MHPDLQRLKDLLLGQYLRHIGTVAFLDESYREERSFKEFPFYTVTATVIHSNDLDKFRQDYLDVVGGNRWHTTDVFSNGGDDSIIEFIEQVSAHETSALVSVQAKVHDNDIELARRECLIQLCSALWLMDCGFVVYERREDAKARNADASLFSKAKHEGYLNRNLKTFAGHPGMEPLLWGPDLVGWALRRKLAVNDSRWIKPLVENIELLDVNVQQKKKGPQPAAAMGSGPDFPVGPEGEERNRSSSKSMPPETKSKQDIYGFFPNISPVPHDPEKLRVWLISIFPERINKKRPRHF